MSGTAIEKILRRLPANMLNAAARLQSTVAGSGYLAHHGIQRAGTNYLNICLKRLGIHPLNSFDGKRNSPRHKHFRWQHDKESIPPFIRSQYGNGLAVDSLSQLNRAASYPAGCRHIVIRKEQNAWLASICNWGLHAGWFSTKSEALGNLAWFRTDYENYYRFWQAMAAANPDAAVLVELERVTGDFGVFLKALGSIGIRYRVPDGFAGFVDTVPMSPAGRTKIVTVDDILGQSE